MSTFPECEKVPDAPPQPEIVERVEAVLARGGLVALPTETVYGLAARADLAIAIEALREVKSRPDDLGLTWHVGDPAAIERFPSVDALVRRLTSRYWPGPLTLVLPGVPPGLEAAARDGWTGVRMPAHKATAGILRKLPFPVAMSSANRHGRAPLSSAEAVKAEFAGEGRVELVLDGGPAPLSQSSSVLLLGAGRFEVLREGVIGLEHLRSTAGLHLGFVCTGNTCRSPMAEGLARKRIAERLGIDPRRLPEFGFVLESMGVLAGHGFPASRLAAAVMKEDGIDLSEHRSRAALARDLLGFDRIYCMTASHREALSQALPPGKDGHLELLDPAGQDVPDPMGGPREDYLEALRLIRAAVERRLAEWV